MAKFIKAFRGVPEGKIYPVEYAAGEECPPELEAGALAERALEQADESNEKEALIAQLEAAGASYDKRWGVAKLQAALADARAKS